MKCKECGHDKEEHCSRGCLHGEKDSYCYCRIKKDAIGVENE